MTRVTIDDHYICVDGHAGDKIVCAMLTALTVSLVNNITTRLNANAAYSIRSGYFLLDRQSVDNNDAMTLIDAYIYSLRELSGSYPDNVVLSG